MHARRSRGRRGCSREAPRRDAPTRLDRHALFGAPRAPHTLALAAQLTLRCTRAGRSTCSSGTCSATSAGAASAGSRCRASCCPRRPSSSRPRARARPRPPPRPAAPTAGARAAAARHDRHRPGLPAPHRQGRADGDRRAPGAYAVARAVLALLPARAGRACACDRRPQRRRPRRRRGRQARARGAARARGVPAGGRRRRVGGRARRRRARRAFGARARSSRSARGPRRRRA